MAYLVYVLVVLRELCIIKVTQGEYHKSLQMCVRLRDILMKVSAESENMADGR